MRYIIKAAGFVRESWEPRDIAGTPATTAAIQRD